MAYILTKILPDSAVITTGSQIHYNKLRFVIYRSESPYEGKISNFRETEVQEGIKEAPQIVVTAQVAESGSLDSQDALCMASDIPETGYSFTILDGWSASSAYNAKSGEVSFTFSTTAETAESLQAVSIELNSFFTKAQTGTCALSISVENFSQYVPEIKDCAYTLPLVKQVNFEILKFTANENQGEFFLNANLPVTFAWECECDADTPVYFLEDGIEQSGVQTQEGEMKLDTRQPGDHVYTIKMVLREGEKTKSLKIRDTRWKEIAMSGGLQPDFAKQNTMLSWQDKRLLFYAGKVYQTALEDEKLADWTVLTEYDGNVVYPDITPCFICGDCLYLIGGTEDGSDEMFGSVYDLTASNGQWTDFDAGQSSSLCGGKTAWDNDTGWAVYAKQVESTLLLAESRENNKTFSVNYMLKLDGLSGFEIVIRGETLYLAVSLGDTILLKTLKRGGGKFANAGKILDSSVWMRWLVGNNGMFLMTSGGLYSEFGWENKENFSLPMLDGTFSWGGVTDGIAVSLITDGSETGNGSAWITDAL